METLIATAALTGGGAEEVAEHATATAALIAFRRLEAAGEIDPAALLVSAGSWRRLTAGELAAMADAEA